MHPALQAAGHDGCRQGNGLFLKPTTQQEIDFYQLYASGDREICQFMPTFMGSLKEVDGDQESVIAVMEDLLEPFVKPSVLDVKLGRILYDMNASLEKRRRLEEVSNNTTSSKLGFRIAGMSVVLDNGERKVYGKSFGREATVADVGRRLGEFWPEAGKSELLRAVWRAVIDRILELRDALKLENVEMRSSSVLVVYEGDRSALLSKINNGEEGVADVRLIDFAHSKRAEKPDTDVLEGLAALAACLETELNDVGAK